MDSSSEAIKNFEEKLMRNAHRKTLTLYSSSERNRKHIQCQSWCKPQSIISNVSSQLKAIQKADNVVSTKHARGDLTKFKKSNFLPVNMLTEDNLGAQQSSHANKFETQFELDTQLMDIIENAEELDTVNKGMTQEFEKAFHENHRRIECNSDGNSTEKNENHTVIIENVDRNDICIEALPTGCTDAVANIDFNDSLEDVVLPCSFVFKPLKKSNTPSPLVFDLNTFEDFEKIALPIIEEHSDIKSAKKLINSQIVGRELIIQHNDQPQFSNGDAPISPVLKLTVDKLKITPDEAATNSLTTNGNIHDNSIIEDGVFLKDEIIFSSDEESDKQLQDLPLTCALETSFYNQSEILDKTIYIGFQTASNRSIQVSSDSYKKAKSFLDSCDEDGDENDKVTLTDLVNMCDSFNINNKELVKDKTKAKNTSTCFTQSLVEADLANLHVSNEKTNDFDKKNDKDCLQNNIIKTVDLKNSKSEPIINFMSIESLNNENGMRKPTSPVKRICKEFTIPSYKKIKLSNLATSEQCILDMNPKDSLGSENTVVENCKNVPVNIGNKPNSFIDTSHIDEDIINEFACDMPVLENNSKSNDIVLSSFKTGGMKNINISESPLAKTNKIFDGIDINEKLDNTSTTSLIPNNLNKGGKSKDMENSKDYTNNIVFKTASNKNIAITDEAFAKSRLILEEFTEFIPDRLQDQCLNWDQPSTSKLHVCGFKTASNKEIKISIDSLAKSKPLLQDIIEDDDAVFNIKSSKALRNTNQSLPHPDTCLGFRTANNKDIKISEEAYSKTKHLFKDIGMVEEDRLNDVDENLENRNTILKTTDVNLEIPEENKNRESLNDSSGKPLFHEDTVMLKFCGLTTAGNKPVNVSEKAIAKSNKLSADLEFDEFNFNNKEDFNYGKGPSIIENEILSDKQKTNRLLFSENSTAFLGFKSASNKEVKISHKALEQSKKLFDDLDLNEFNNKNEVTHGNNCDTVSSFAKNKTIRVIENENCVQWNENSTAFLGFKSASNKEVKISDKALAQSKKLFADLDLNDYNFNKKEDKIISVEENENCLQLNKNSTAFTGFRSASNKEVKISEKALAQSKKLFSDLEVDSHIADYKNPTFKNIDIQPSKNSTATEVCKGFQTASKKPIKISAQALSKSMKLFKDIDNDNDNCDSNVNNSQNCIIQANSDNSIAYKEPVFRGFQTSSGKPVEISAEVLAKSKSLFKDIEDNTVEQNQDNIRMQKFSNSKRDVPANDEIVTTSNKFSNIHETENNVSKVEEKPIGFCGFKTASKKKVLISDQALGRSRKIFQDIDMDGGLEKTSDRRALGFCGFETASKKKVLVSNQALEKSRKIFQDLDMPGGQGKTVDPALCNDKENQSNRIQETHSNFKSVNNDDGKVSENVMIKSKRLCTDSAQKSNKIQSSISNNKPQNIFERLIDTQVMHNFEETLCTEDFCKETTTPKNSKRSGSPILSCPKAKKRKKFETPYKTNVVTKGTAIPNIGSVIDIVDESVMLFNVDYKKMKRYKLKDLAEAEKNTGKFDTSSFAYFSQFNFDKLLNFQFIGKRNDLSDIDMSVEDVKNLFLSMVNKKLVPEGWLDNHLRLVIWKLISYEMKFPNTLSGVCSVRNLLDQLKYRYDKELYNAERPALRKILEKDDIASKTMVLCVAAIYVDGVSVSSITNDTANVELLLTDGWYCIKSTIDKMLTKLVYDERITIGCKIITNGAELVNCDQGVAPWEDTSCVRLKIFGNSTRPARWDARLGYHGNAAILTQLSSVKVEGGKVSKLRLYVTRVYPALYVEKFEDGSTVTRSERLESLHLLKYESERQLIIEKLYEEVEKELSDQESQDSESSYNDKRRRLCISSELITSTQTRSLEERSNKRRDRMIQNIEKRLQEKMESYGVNVNRNVVPLLKIRVAAFKKSSKETTKGLLSIWKPNDAIAEIIREGVWMEVLNVVPTAIRYGEIQISAGRNTVFRDSKYTETDEMLPYTKSLKRKCYHIKELAKNPIMITDYNEIDTVGFIFQIDPPTANFDHTKQPFQNLYLTDADKHIICVNFWGGLKKFGYQNVLNTGQVIACVNLQKRSGNSKKTIPHYRVTEFSYFTKTPKHLEARNMLEELEKKMAVLDKRKYCQECLVLRNNFNKISGFNNENISPYRINNNHNLTRNKIFIDSPLANKPVDDNLNLTGLDFESTFKQEEMSPQQLLRKKKVNEKIAKLKMYGEPPPLSPIHIINKSKNAFNSFKSPLATNDNVASLRKLAENSRKNEDSAIQSSPILCMNRTFVKKGNPVRLNFSKVQEDKADEKEVDHFAEDFDASPPLSLD
ncbi:hypothetical protein evm_003734 [Chilo suppressalis]|nr:hypothetical protein evm_003734 [Chilo suppressalis]